MKDLPMTPNVIEVYDSEKEEKVVAIIQTDRHDKKLFTHLIMGWSGNVILTDTNCPRPKLNKSYRRRYFDSLYPAARRNILSVVFK